MKAARILLAALAAILLLLLALPHAAGWFVFRPEPLESADPGRWRLAAREIAFLAADGSRLSGWWIAPPDAGAPVILLVHGRSGNISTRAAIARRLAADGFGMMLFDYRGYGASTGTPSEAAIGEDALSAYSWLRGQGVGPERIVVLGQSLGNAPAARLAALRPVRALALVSPFASLPEATADRLWWLPLGLLPWPRNRFEVAEHLARITAPILFVVSRDDSLVPVAHSERLAASLVGRVRWMEEQEGGHDRLLERVVEAGRLQPALRDLAQEPGR